MPQYRIRSSFLNFDRYFESVEEMAEFVNSNFEISLKVDEVLHHFVDNNVPFFGVKGIIITKEAQKQEVNSNNRNDSAELA